MDNSKLVWTIIGAVILAGVYLGLGLLVNTINGFVALSVPIWTLATALIVLPYVGIKVAKRMRITMLADMGLAIVIIGVLAVIVPAASFLYTPFTTSAEGAVGFFALLAHLAMAAVITELIVKEIGK